MPKPNAPDPYDVLPGLLATHQVIKASLVENWRERPDDMREAALALAVIGPMPRELAFAALRACPVDLSEIVAMAAVAIVDARLTYQAERDASALEVPDHA